MSSEQSLMHTVALLREEAIRTWVEHRRNNYRDCARELEFALAAFSSSFDVKWVRVIIGLHARAEHLLNTKEEVA